jgi:transcriptional regulator with XRE-family HTH domain
MSKISGMRNMLKDWLNQQLNKLDWNYSDLGERIGIKSGNLSNMLSSKRGLPLNFFIETSKVLNVSTDYLFYLSGMLPLRNIEEGLSKAYNQLSPDKKQEVVDFAEFLLQKQSQEQPQNER